MKIFITGDSHTGALKFGLDMLMDQGDLPLDHRMDIKPFGPGGGLKVPFFIDRGDFAEITNERYAKHIKRLPFSDEQEHYDYYGICRPLYGMSLWWIKNYWQKYTPFASQDGQAPVSTSLLRHAALRDQRYMMQLIELLKRVGVKVFVIEGPKPYKHHPTLNTANRDVIAYVEEFYRKAIRDWLASKEVPVINVPSECYDANGFMLEIFRHDNPNDPCHANKEFGAIMIKEIIKFADSKTIDSSK